MTEPASSRLPIVVGGVFVALIASAAAYRGYLEMTTRETPRVVAEPAARGVAPAPSAPVAIAPRATTNATSTAPPAQPTVPPPAPSPARSATAEMTEEEREQKIVLAQREVRIDLYGEGWCPSCRAAKRWLEMNKISFNYRDTGNPANARMMRSLNPEHTIPVIDIEGTILVGFDPDEMQAQIRRRAEMRVAAASR